MTIGLVEASPSKELYRIMLAKVSTPTSEQLQSLVGKMGYFPDDNFAGTISEVKGFNVYAENEFGIEKDSLEDFMYLGDLNEGGRGRECLQIKFVETNYGSDYLHTKNPDLIGFAPDAYFGSEDPELDKILADLMVLFPTVSTPKDLKRLTHHIHSVTAYNGGQIDVLRESRPLYDTQRDYLLPLGKVLIDYGAVCLQIAGVEYSYMQLKGIDAQMMGAKVGSERHAYLEVPFDGEIYVADPTWDLWGKQNEILEELEQGERVSDFHKQYSPIAIRALWTNT